MKNKESHHTVCLLNYAIVCESQKANFMNRNYEIALLCQYKRSSVENMSAPGLGHNLCLTNENTEELLPDSSLFQSRLPCIVF